MGSETSYFMKKALQNIGVSKMWKKKFLVCACILDDGVLYWGHSYYLNKSLVTMDFSLNLIMASHIINFWKYMSWGVPVLFTRPPFLRFCAPPHRVCLNMWSMIVLMCSTCRLPSQHQTQSAHYGHYAHGEKWWEIFSQNFSFLQNS